MQVDFSGDWLMSRAADALSFFRALASIVASVAILLGPDWWLGVVILLGLAGLTEPLDGRVARMRPFQRRWFPLAKGSGKAANEMATGALAVLVPAAIWVRLLVALVAGWTDSGWTYFVYWTVMCAIFLGGTLLFNKAKEVLVPSKAEQAEVWQAWFTAFIVMASAGILAYNGELMNGGLFILIEVVITVLVCVLSGDRLTERRLERDQKLYRGSKARLFSKGL